MGVGKELVLRRRDGSEVPVDISLSPIDLPEGSVVVAAVRDITELRRNEHQRERAQEDLESQQGVLERIARNEPLAVTLEALCRYIEHRYDGTRCSILLADHEAGVLRHAAAPSLPDAFRRAIDGLPIGEGAGACGTAAALGELVVVEDTLRHPYTSAFVVLAEAHELRSVWSHPLMNVHDKVLGTFAVYRREPHQPDDEEMHLVLGTGGLAALAIEREEAERLLTAAANVDPLTGLPNRAWFRERLTSCLGGDDCSIAVMFLDLDRFKWINDSLGHPAGDKILVEVAARLEQAVGTDHAIARFGGDEFTVLIERRDAGADLARGRPDRSGLRRTRSSSTVASSSCRCRSASPPTTTPATRSRSSATRTRRCTPPRRPAVPGG